MQRVRARDGGFTLTEMMIVLVIVGVMAGIAAPLAGRDRRGWQARQYASELARDLQKSRVQAVADRLPLRAYVFRDRVEFRSGLPGATEAAAPIAPSLATPVREVLAARPDVSIYAVTGAAAIPAGQVLNTVAPVEIEFAATGGAQLVGAPQMTGAFIYIRNDRLNPGHPNRDYRIDVSALTGFVRMQDRW